MGRIAVSLRIDPSLWKNARKHAIDKDISVVELIETCLKKEMNTLRN